MNLDLLIEALEKISGTLGDARWYVDEAADNITSMADDIEEQEEIALLLDDLHRDIRRVEEALDAKIDRFRDQERYESKLA